MKDVIIVVPTIREEFIKRFIEEWSDHFFDNERFSCKLLIIEDNPQKSFKLDSDNNVEHLCWEDIKNELGKDSWIIPRRTDCVRSFGYYKAYQQEPDMIVTMDDDCYPLKKHHPESAPQKNFLGLHWRNLKEMVTLEEERWVSTIEDFRPRGLPYKNLKNEVSYSNIVLSHGLWYNVPDFDGMSQVRSSQIEGQTGYAKKQVIPKGKFYSMCGMNLAWKPEITPILYFLLMGQSEDGGPWGYDRFGDIWAGVLSKKIIDHLEKEVYSGYPIIWHDRASNPFSNIVKEAPGLQENEWLWEAVDDITLTASGWIDSYLELAEKIPQRNQYWKKQKEAMQVWSDLYS